MSQHPHRPAASSRPRGPRLPSDSLALALFHAADLVAGVRQGHTLTAGLADLWREQPRLDDKQRGAIQDLAYGTLRDFGHGEQLIQPLLRSEAPDPVYSLLLVAAFRLGQRPEQAHTIVDQSVEAAGQQLGGKLRGLANGVLRNLLRQHPALEAATQTSPESCHRHPRWWLEALQLHYPGQWEAIAAAGNLHPPMALRANRRRIDPATLQVQLAAADIAAALDTHGALLLQQARPVGQIPGFAAGLCSVQDPGAQRAAPWLDLVDGQRVLDACAAPGGKTAHILESADVELTALDMAPERLARVAQNLERLGLHAELKAADCRALERWWDGRLFDRILADVPCSASGVVRRHPDIKWLRRPEDIELFAAQQREILDQLWHTLAPGGKMLYATCSVFPRENADQLATFRMSHPDARLLPLDAAPEQQLLPCAQHDGFYYALLEKAR